MATIQINGVTYTGNSVNIINGRVIVDGREQDGDKLSGVVEIRVVEGLLQNLSSDASINCGSVQGNVSAGGSVNCDRVGGSVTAGGSVNCDDIGGNVSAGGSIRRG